MKTIMIVLVLAATGVGATAGPDSLLAIKVLREAQRKIRETHTLTYHSEYRQVTPQLEDSVFAISGTMWLERVPTDTIFGYRFHIRGEGFDYYYNGKTSREFRHGDKEITEFNPYEENSDHSPAKARVALVPVQPLETDTNLVADVQKTYQTLSAADSGRAWVLTLERIPNHPGGETATRQIWVNKDSYRVTREDVHGTWNGTRYSRSVRITALAVDAAGTADSIAERGAYATYKTTHYIKPAPRGPSPLEGTMASDFTYTAYDGQSIRLSALRGRYVLLDFWESWCGWCIDAFPHLKELDSVYKGKPFTLLGMVSENLTQVKEIVDNNHLPYSTLRADSTVIKNYRVEGRPTYVLIDPAGKIIAYGPGDLDRMKALLKQRMP